MNEKLLNSNLLEGILKTILVFDILETGVSLKNIQKHLIGAKASEVEILEILDFLCGNQIIIKLDNLYMLYNKQEDKMHKIYSPKFNAFQKLVFKFFNLSGWVDGVFLMERPKAKPILIFKFYKEIHRRKKEKICNLASNIIGLRVFHAGIVPKDSRNALSATFLVGLKPVINAEALETFWNRNSWIFEYCHNSSMDYEALINDSRKRNHSLNKRNKISAFKSVGAFNISSYFKHLNNKTDFNQEYSNRLLYASQWIIPRIRHQIKRNQIV